MVVGTAEGTDELPIPAAASGDTSSQTQTQTDEDAVMAEKEKIFMGDLNRMIDKYNAKKRKQQDDALTSCLQQKRPASTLTVTDTRHKESTVMNNHVELKELLKAEEERCVRYGRQWADRVRELMQYCNDNGNCNVPCKHSSLGIWVANQRTEFKKSRAGKASSMTPHRVNILNHIGFVWDASDKSAVKTNDEGWMQMFEELMEYKEQHGDCLVPKKYEGNTKLAKWVSHQRQQYQNNKMGKTSPMTEERIYKLEQIGFVWDASDKIGGGKRNDEGWMQMFEQLMEYKEQHGDCLVPQVYEGNPKLGKWVSRQRYFYHRTKMGKSTRMTEERQHKLEELGFVWKAKR